LAGAALPAAILSAMSARALRSTRSLLLAIACGLLCAACDSVNQPNQSNPSNPNGADARPSPIPAGYSMLLARGRGEARQYTEGGDTVDELLAVVDGEFLTRQEVSRRLRLPATRQPNASEEQEIRAARLEWARQRLVVSAARRAGLRLPESSMDEIAMDHLKREIKKHEAASGEELSPEEYLEQKDITWKEFREQAKGDITHRYFMQKLLIGIGPTRPEVDMETSPAEVRRIYYDNREFFRKKPSVRRALFAVSFEKFEAEGVDVIEAEAKALEEAEKIKGAFERGNEAWLIAAHFKLDENDWSVDEPDEFIDRFRHRMGHEWLFDEKREVGDSVILHDPAGPLVLGLLEKRPGGPSTLEEVYDEIQNLVAFGKERRLSAELTIQQLNRGSVVWPDELADELLDWAHALLDEIATHDVLGRARLR